MISSVRRSPGFSVRVILRHSLVGSIFLLHCGGIWDLSIFARLSILSILSSYLFVLVLRLRQLGLGLEVTEAHIEDAAFHKEAVKSRIEAMTAYIEDATAHIEDATACIATVVAHIEDAQPTYRL